MNGAGLSKELEIADRVTALLDRAVGEQLVVGSVNEFGEPVVKIDLNGLQAAVKILKTVAEIKKEAGFRETESSGGGVVVLPETDV